jgi:hypothetical protein
MKSLKALLIAALAVGVFMAAPAAEAHPRFAGGHVMVRPHVGYVGPRVVGPRVYGGYGGGYGYGPGVYGRPGYYGGRGWGGERGGRGWGRGGERGGGRGWGGRGGRR